MTRLMLTACAAGLIAAAAAPATAADGLTHQTGTVRIGDLNLSTQAGAQALLRRAGNRFADLCARIDSPLDRNRTRAERACVTEAMANMVAKLNAPIVAAEYAHQYGRPVILANVR